ncbi:Subtilisin family serine protease OS=Streptomyces albaduncus OX=68172 GN=FHS32_006764 PE=3 SV=1 [Streptomyces griseoloalbus]
MRVRTPRRAPPLRPTCWPGRTRSWCGCTRGRPGSPRSFRRSAPNAVEGSYIVTLKPGTQAASTKGKGVARKYGADVERTFREAVNGYTVEATEAEAAELAADPSVALVEQNRAFTIQATQTNPPSWGLDRIDQTGRCRSAAAYTYDDTAGQGVTAYIIDTGVRISHSDFGGRARNGYDAVDGDNVAQDGNGHGTHVAGTVAGSAYGVAKKASIVGVRVLDNNGSGTTAGVIAGRRLGRRQRGPARPSPTCRWAAAPSTTLDNAVRNAIAAGVTFAVAAGNESTTATGSPARVAEAITVGATTSTDARASYSNYGSNLEIFAPGSPITSTWNTATAPPTPSPAPRWPPRTSRAPRRCTSRTTRRPPRRRSPPRS